VYGFRMDFYTKISMKSMKIAGRTHHWGVRISDEKKFVLQF